MSLCRTCLRKNNLQLIFPDSDLAKIRTQQIFCITGVKIELNDGLPQHMCVQCVGFLYGALKLRELTQKSNVTLKNLNSANNTLNTEEVCTFSNNSVEYDTNSQLRGTKKINNESQNLELKVYACDSTKVKAKRKSKAKKTNQCGQFDLDLPELTNESNVINNYSIDSDTISIDCGTDNEDIQPENYNINLDISSEISNIKKKSAAPHTSNLEKPDSVRIGDYESSNDPIVQNVSNKAVKDDTNIQIHLTEKINDESPNLEQKAVIKSEKGAKIKKEEKRDLENMAKNSDGTLIANYNNEVIIEPEIFKIEFDNSVQTKDKKKKCETKEATTKLDDIDLGVPDLNWLNSLNVPENKDSGRMINTEDVEIIDLDSDDQEELDDLEFDILLKNMREMINDLRETEKREWKYMSLAVNPHERSGRIRCRLCKKDLKNKTSFIMHAKTHYKLEHPCEECGKRFITANHVKYHQQRMHGREKRLACELCQYRAVDQITMRNHIRATHTGERPYICDVCGLAFRMRRNIAQHMRKHFGVRDVQCEHCSALFKSASGLGDHKKKVHFLIYTYYCYLCSGTFRKICSARKHIARVHGIPKNEQIQIKCIKTGRNCEQSGQNMSK